MNTYVIYHKNCFDGYGAMWVAWNALLKKNVVPILVPAGYGDEAPQIDPKDEVYIVDFSYPRDILRGMDFLAGKMVVLDHHKTAKENLEGLDYCQFDMNRSGAGLAWDHFHPGQPRPKLIDYMEDRDLWRFALPHSKEIFAYVASFPMEQTQWDILAAELEDDIEGFWNAVKQGGAILRSQTQLVERACKEVIMIEVAGHVVPVVNVPYFMASDVGHRLLEGFPNEPFAATYFITGLGEQQWSLRGRDTDDFDVSAVAKTYGGGGHKKAAGFIKGRDTRG